MSPITMWWNQHYGWQRWDALTIMPLCLASVLGDWGWWGIASILGAWGVGRAWMPDLVGLDRLGRAGFVECKTSVGRLTKEQLEFLCNMKNCGAWVRVFVENELYELTEIPDRNMPPRRKRSGAVNAARGMR